MGPDGIGSSACLFPKTCVKDEYSGDCSVVVVVKVSVINGRVCEGDGFCDQCLRVYVVSCTIVRSIEGHVVGGREGTCDGDRQVEFAIRVFLVIIVDTSRCSIGL